MKSIFMILTVIMITIAGFAQQPGKDTIKKDDQTIARDSIIMKEGVVLISKEGTRTAVLTEITLGGTKVQADGSIIFKDGTIDVLKEGDVILSNGKLVRATIKAERSGLPKDKQP